MAIKILLILIFSNGNFSQNEIQNIPNKINNTIMSQQDNVLNNLKPETFDLYGLQFNKKNELLIKSLVINFILFFNFVLMHFFTKIFHHFIGNERFYCKYACSLNKNLFNKSTIIHCLSFLLLNFIFSILIKLIFKKFYLKKYLLDNNIFFFIQLLQWVIFSFIPQKQAINIQNSIGEKIIVKSILKRSWNRYDTLLLIIFILFLLISIISMTILIINYQEYKSNMMIIFKKCWKNKTIKLNKNTNNNYFSIGISYLFLLIYFFILFFVLFLEQKRFILHKDT